MSHKRQGFTLSEIVIVVAIIVLLAAIAIPNIMRIRLNANETSAISSIRAISAAAQSYKVNTGLYPANLYSLGPETVTGTPAAAYCAAVYYLDERLGYEGSQKDGYVFNLTGTTASFTATGKPRWHPDAQGAYRATGVRSFFVDESGIIRWTDAFCGGGNNCPASTDPALE